MPPKSSMSLVCWINFLYISQLPELIFWNSYNANDLFLHLKASHFGIKNQSQNNVFPRHFPGHPFLRFDVDFIGKLSIWRRFQNQVGAKIR